MVALQKTSTFNTAPFTRGSTIIIGLSGGPDSVYLLHKLVELRDLLGLSLVAAHLDHEWRASSKDDAAFCQKLCTLWQVPLILKKASELPVSFRSNGSQEEMGRNMRRSFLESVRHEHTADYIALAHHRDDQLETFFINLIRGTTITGLGGMNEREGFFIRPLLNTSKQEILAYLSEHQIPYQTDPTNCSEAYLRNRIRARLIPALAACDERALVNMGRAMGSLKDTEQFLKATTEQAVREVTDAAHSLDLGRFFALDPYVQKRVLSRWLSVCSNGTCRSSEAFLDEVLRFLQSPRGGMHHISDKGSIIKKQGLASLKCSTPPNGERS